MRTDQEILDRIQEMLKWNVAGLTYGDLSSYLPFEALKTLLSARVAAAIEERGVFPAQQPRDDQTIRGKIIHQLPSAWRDANNCNLLATQINLLNFSNLLWLLGDDFFSQEIIIPGDYFGKKALVIISEAVGFDWRELDDDIWVTEDGDSVLHADEALEK